ncbi:MAG: hypothetical protein DRP96_10520 [Candidatus Neomarinimicrobiota bacterium]|nr:MAG: hypothetical protein DRP96_10520 [Candidatus Neomarinimicrobiota bacterium]
MSDKKDDGDEVKKAFILSVLLLLFLFNACDKEITKPADRNLLLDNYDYILPDYFVTAIAFDSRGTAWIGTFKQGIIKYNGSATYYDSDNSNLPDSIVVRDIAVDKNNVVWIGSDAGLIKYSEDRFTVYDTANSPLAENVVWSIAVDADNVLWLASCRFRQGGLMTFDGLNWTLYTPDNSEMPANGIQSITIDSQNRIWLTAGNAGCVVRISNNAWTIFGEEEIGFRPYYPWDIAVDGEDAVYVTIDYRLSSLADMTRPNLIKYNGKNWTVINPVDENGESLGYVECVCCDLDGKVWVSVYGGQYWGLAVYDGNIWKYNDGDGLFGSIFEIAADQENTMWIGTGSGIYLIEQ